MVCSTVLWRILYAGGLTNALPSDTLGQTQ